MPLPLRTIPNMLNVSTARSIRGVRGRPVASDSSCVVHARSLSFHIVLTNRRRSEETEPYAIDFTACSSRSPAVAAPRNRLMPSASLVNCFTSRVPSSAYGSCVMSFWALYRSRWTTPRIIDTH